MELYCARHDQPTHRRAADRGAGWLAGRRRRAAEEKIAGPSKEIGDLERNIARSTSASLRRSKQRRLEAKLPELGRAQAKLAVVKGKPGDKLAQLNRALPSQRGAGQPRLRYGAPPRRRRPGLRLGGRRASRVRLTRGQGGGRPRPRARDGRRVRARLRGPRGLAAGAAGGVVTGPFAGPSSPAQPPQPVRRCGSMTTGLWRCSHNPVSRPSSTGTPKRDVYQAEATGVGSAPSVPSRPTGPGSRARPATRSLPRVHPTVAVLLPARRPRSGPLPRPSPQADAPPGGRDPRPHRRLRRRPRDGPGGAGRGNGTGVGLSASGPGTPDRGGSTRPGCLPPPYAARPPLGAQNPDASRVEAPRTVAPGSRVPCETDQAAQPRGCARLPPTSASVAGRSTPSAHGRSHALRQPPRRLWHSPLKSARPLPRIRPAETQRTFSLSWASARGRIRGS